MKLPVFRYHPHPISTKAIKRRSTRCACCDKDVEYAYVAPAYSTHDLSEKLCPWCIADGTAHEKFDVTFADEYPLSEAGLSQSIVDEVTCRTAGFTSWQQERWLSHCNDACVFLGDATLETVRNLTADEMSPLIEEHGVDESWFRELGTNYQPGGQHAIYHFQCLHCGINRFGMDYT